MRADVTQEIWQFAPSDKTDERGFTKPVPEYSLQRWSNIPDNWTLNDLRVMSSFTRSQLLEFADWLKTVVINADNN